MFKLVYFYRVSKTRVDDYNLKFSTIVKIIVNEYCFRLTIITMIDDYCFENF